MKNKIPERLKLADGPKKLNMGCGYKYLEGWINLDLSDKDIYDRKVKVDVTHDLDKFPYPFPDDSFDFVLVDNVLEHLEKPARIMEELERICKNNAIIKVVVPHFSGYKAYTDYTHKHYFTLDSMSLILRTRKIEIIRTKLEISDNALIRLVGKLFTMFSLRVYERFLYGYFPSQGITWILRVRK
jgi:SAM-dependent methyltransferase